MTYGAMSYPDSDIPFRFEDLPLNADDKRVEPEKWGPIYSKPSSKPAHRRAYDPPTNAPSGQKGPIVDDAKFRAKLKAEFTAIVNAERRAWADGKLTINRPGFSGNIVTAYEQAMTAKRARLAALAAVEDSLANLLAEAALKRKPHYVLRNGEWKLAA